MKIASVHSSMFRNSTNLISDHQESALRRDPLTGEFINLASSASVYSLTGRLQNNGYPVSGEPFDPNDPLLRLGSSALVEDAAWQTHKETIRFVQPLLGQNAGYALAKAYVERFEELVPREDVAELVIREERINGRVSSTITGYSEPTTATTRLQAEASRWTRRTGNDLLADILTAELMDAQRILVNSAHWIAYRPYAAAHETEYIMMPKRPMRNIVATEEEEREDLARVYGQVIAQLNSEQGQDADYTSVWQMAPIPYCREISRMRIHIVAD